jgi:hypothetical protein
MFINFLGSAKNLVSELGGNAQYKNNLENIQTVVNFRKLGRLLSIY